MLGGWKGAECGFEDYAIDVVPSISLEATFAGPPSASSTPMLSPPSSSTMASSSRLAPIPRRPKDVFKPKFPIDPFAHSSAAALAEPWFIRLDALLAATALQRRNVIFVIGAPSLKELAPLLQSQHLSNSLVILATHSPPDIPAFVYPTVRILHLSAPIALEDSGAVRFVNVLEWGERIARSWRKLGGAGVLELSEEIDINSQLPPPPVLHFGSQSTPTSPGSSLTHLSSHPSPSRPSSRPSSISGSFFSRKGQSPPPPDPSQRPFDVLVHFMPDNLPDKALLKISILVTTISRPFLASSVHPSPPSLRTRTTSSDSPRFRPLSILGTFSRSSTSVYLPPTPPYHSGESLSLAPMMPAPPGKALLIHLLPDVSPAPRRRLVDGIESFLLSFAYQSPVPSFQQVPGFGKADILERARPYVMPVATFAATVESDVATDAGEWKVADIVLGGVLDADTPAGSVADGAPSGLPTTKSANAIQKLVQVSKRAWIAAVTDLVIMPFSDDPSVAAENARTLPLIHQSRPFDRARSSSAPLLSDLGVRGVSPPLAGIPATASWHSKGAYKPTSPVSQSGLPTPPPSEEESGTDCFSVDAHADTEVAMSSKRGADQSERDCATGTGSVRRSRWKFWRRLGTEHVLPLKA